MADALRARQERLLARLLRAEVRLACAPDGRASDADGGADAAWGDLQPLLGEAHARLAAELQRRGLRVYRFVRVPPDYYSTTLEVRRRCLRAHSVHHLCKTVRGVRPREHTRLTRPRMASSTSHAPPCAEAGFACAAQICVENTSWAPMEGKKRGELEESSNPRFLLVVVQYNTRFDAEKLKSFIVERSQQARKRVNLRLARPEDSERLTGYRTGGVTPIAVATPELPIVLSERIARLQPDVFWLGAGDVDLKLGMRVCDFVARYAPAVVDVTDA
jgi:prolyl-tRNA editing enzyme YbaK/EbsC (Cys-tRNA(Pro) deacylase)